MNKRTAKVLSASKLRELAVEAQADPRSVAKVLAGKPIKGGALDERIRSALRKAGLMAALVVSLAVAGACDSAGNPVAGGAATFLVPGTANQQVVPWADADATAAVPLVNGSVPLDAGGRATVYLNQPADIRIDDASGQTVATYKEVGGTAAGVEVLNAGFTGTLTSGALGAGGRTRLDTVLSSIAASLGGTDALFLAVQGATGRTVRDKFTEVQVSVKDFGAVGNGVADDTAAIQATFNYVVALGGGTVFFPPGTYLVTSAINTGSINITVAGAGIGTSTIRNGSGSASVFVQGAGTYRMFVRDILITSSGGSSGNAITVNALRGTYLDRVYIDGHANAVSNSTSASVYFTSSTMTGTTSGVVSTGSVFALSTSFTGANAYGLSVTGSAGVQASVSLCTFSGLTAGLNIGTNIALFASSSTAGFGSPGLVIAAAAGEILTSSCDWGTVTDNRTGAPVNYALTSSTAVTPLPQQAAAIRIDAQAGTGTVTVNAPASSEFGRMFLLKCRNSSGGAVTWTFNAAYHLSAAVSPATGNQVNLILAYDPITGHWDEQGRGAVSN